MQGQVGQVPIHKYLHVWYMHVDNTHIHTYIINCMYVPISLNNGPGVYYLYSLPAPGVKLRQAFI